MLRGEWLGHAVHPMLTDVAIGTWTSASVLDLLGGPDSSAAAQRLIGTGLLAAGPTAWTGWAEWSAAGSRDKRVGLVHAVTNAVAIGVYAASWLARRRGRHGTGARLALAGAAVSGAGAYLGGHLAEARKVASRHPAYDELHWGSDRRSVPTTLQRRAEPVVTTTSRAFLCIHITVSACVLRWWLPSTSRTTCPAPTRSTRRDFARTCCKVSSSGPPW